MGFFDKVFGSKNKATIKGFVFGGLFERGIDVLLFAREVKINENEMNSNVDFLAFT